ncbi:MAG: hypothetical protein KGH88_09035 [Thaumarchaeota archaeon]|nr:hypothetical protein [Nitrososphaerota archaeon]
MKTLLAVSITGFLLSAMTFSILPDASAHGLCLPLQPRFGRLDDVAFSNHSVHTGDSILITGKLVSVLQKDQRGLFVMASTPPSHGRWFITSTEPAGNMIDVPGNSEVPFSLTVKALQPGTYKTAPVFYLPKIGPAFSMFTGCNTEPVVTVVGDPLCEDGFVAVSKAEDNSTVCVRPETASSLVERGWASGIILSKGIEESQASPANAGNASASLKLSLSTDTDHVEYGKYIGISISVNNTSQNKVTAWSQDTWPLKNLTLEPCMPRPFGIAVYEGYYQAGNITAGNPRGIFNPAPLCPPINRTLDYL